MSDNSSFLSTPSNGMNLDIYYLNKDGKSYAFALNTMVSDFFEGGEYQLQNEPSNFINVKFPPNYRVIGFDFIPQQNRTIFALVNQLTGGSQIGEVLSCNFIDRTDQINKVLCGDCNAYASPQITPLEQQIATPYCSYTMLVSDICLNFDINYPIDFETKLTNCSLNIYITDSYNPRRFMYFNYTDPTNFNSPLVLQDQFKTILNPGAGPCPVPTYGSVDCNKILADPNYNHPCIEFIDFVDGGKLQAGSYEVLIAYADRNGNALSNYFASSPVAPLFDSIVGDITDFTTSKALYFRTNNLETNLLFNYYNVVIAETVSNFTTFKLVGMFPTSQTSYTYTGYENTIKKISSEEVFARKVYYPYSKNVTSANGYLFNSGVREFPTLNLQPIVNQLQLQWCTVALPEGAYFNPQNTFYFRSCMRDEVYPFALVFEMTNGDETCAFHIPGRAAISTDLTVITNNDIIQSQDCSTNLPSSQPKWMVYNTGSVTGGDYNYNQNCELGNCWEYGEFSYWESTETYPQIPQVWGALCGQPIRHHKFPDSCVTHIHDNANTSTGTAASYKANNYIFPIGVRLDPTTVKTALDNAVTSGLISQFDRDRIIGYRIVRGNRVGNKSIIAKGMLYNMWSYSRFGNTYYYANYPYNDLRNDYFLSPTANYNNGNTSDPIPSVYSGPNDRYTFHSPDTSFTSPSIGSIIKLETEEYGTSEGFFTHSDCQAQYKFLSEFAKIFALGLAIAAAWSATGNRECRVLTYKGDDIIPAYTVSTSGTTPVGFVTGNLLSGSGAIRTTSVGESFSANSNVPIVTIQHDNLTNQIGYDQNGNPISSDTQTTRLTYSAGTTYTYTDPNLTVVVPQASITNPTITYHFVLTSGSMVNDDLNPDGTVIIVITQPVKPDNIQITQCTGQPYQEFTNNIIIQGIAAPLAALASIIIPTITPKQINQYIQRIILTLNELQTITQTINALIPYRNYAIQYDSVGKYNNYTCVGQAGFKIRQIERGVYLDPILQSINEPIAATSGNPTPTAVETIFVNNWERESSVYLKTPTAIPFNNITDHADTSRIRLSDIGGYDNLDQSKYYQTVSSYYASIKNYVPNQYGQLCNIEYLETSSCSFDCSTAPITYTDCQTQVFGGDVFINRFGLKKKMPFWLHTTCKLPNDSDIDYAKIPNVAFPNYYIQSDLTLGERIDSLNWNIITDIGLLLGVANTRLDCKKEPLFYQDGYYYVYNYGIPYFLVESDINVDYRYAINNLDKDFYPRTTNLKFWLEETNVPLAYDNTYYYNTTYSKQNKESYICTSCILNYQDFTCNNANHNRLIYSDLSTTDNTVGQDSWLMFKANNFYDFPFTLGKLISADGIENEKILVRLENASQIFNAYDELQSTSENIQVGTDGLFTSRPKDIAITDLGYAGTQHTTILHTEFGHIWADAKRGQVFILGQDAKGATSIDEISKDGMKNWFKENLPFQIKRDFPTINDTDVDNNFKGIGLHMTFDKRFNRMLITKLDYKVLNTNPKVQYDPTTKVFYINTIETPVQLTDNRYFCNKSWTISYNFYTKMWTSFHSYIPNFYVNYIDNFDSSFISGDTQSTYTHNLSNKSYQVFYNTLRPFIVEYYGNPDTSVNFLDSIEYHLDVIRYHNEFDAVYNREITFNKAIVYNDRQCSGLLNLVVSNPDDFTQTINYPQRTEDGVAILVSNSENIWRFNDFFDAVSSQTSNVPFFTYDCANVNKNLNPQNLNYDKFDVNRPRLRQRLCRIRLINDKWSQYKFITSFLKVGQTKSYR